MRSNTSPLAPYAAPLLARPTESLFGEHDSAAVTRRSFQNLVGTAVLGWNFSPLLAQAKSGPVNDDLTLERCIYLILRVEEGTVQEERLISSGVPHGVASSLLCPVMCLALTRILRRADSLLKPPNNKLKLTSSLAN